MTHSYSGFKSGAFGITVTNSVYYYCYESLKSTFSNGNRKQLTIKQSMLSSLLAGTAVVLTTHPIWTVNVICIYVLPSRSINNTSLMNRQRSRFKNAYHLVKSIPAHSRCCCTHYVERDFWVYTLDQKRP